MVKYQSGENEKASLLTKWGLRKQKQSDLNLEGTLAKREKRKAPRIELVNNIFDKIENEIVEYVIGQGNYLKKLCIAFKRPFVVDNEKSYKNFLIVLGPGGTGKKYSVRIMAKFLSIHGLIPNSSIYRLDLSTYDNEKNTDKLFLPDLHKAFHSDSSIVILENFDRADSKAIDYLCKLVEKGTIRVDKRFSWKSGEMQDVTGAYISNTHDDISANGKYVILVADRDLSYVSKVFPNFILEKIVDILCTQRLSLAELTIIAESMLEDFSNKLTMNVNLFVNYSNIASQLCEIINMTKGAHDLENVIEKSLYNPMLEKSLSGEFHPGTVVTLEIIDGILFGNNVMISEVYTGKNEEALIKIKQELDCIIGLIAVKEFVIKLDEYITFERKRNKTEDAKISLNMVFCGNPGTGKTTVARIIAKYLRELGYLSSGHLVEVSRDELVGQYIGETAQKTANKIKEALGGVLFIDEAYSLSRNKQDIYGIEVIDTLVKYMEDYRDDLVVILAGYTEEMQYFMSSNPGLKSRFKYTVDFQDYTSAELLQIAEQMANKQGYQLESDCKKELLLYFDKKQIPGKKDSGNGRMVRNMVEIAMTNYVHRITAELENDSDNENSMLLKTVDFEIYDNASFDLESELEKIIGLDNIKKLIRNLQVQLLFDRKRREAGFDIDSKQSLNMVFVGNPGTGKTYIARTVAKLLKNLNVLKTDQFIETDRNGLVAQYAGQSSQKTQEIFMSALGGVLFIDEAYSLSSTNSFDREAIDTLVKLIEDNAGNIVVIIAGYKKEMARFMMNNSGLSSRFNLTFDFPDYTTEELYSILKKQAVDKGFVIDEGASNTIHETLEIKSAEQEYSGNGRLVRNLLEEAIRRQTERLASYKSDEDNKNEMILLRAEDFLVDSKYMFKDFDLEKKLASIVGLESVKDYLRSLYSMLRVQKARKEIGIEDSGTQTLHMIYCGNPGTGKTTIARLVGEILYEMGILANRNFIETDRAGLVAGYVGQTAIKTKEVIKQALDGVLFIDEAYSLSNDASNGGFGKEAIDTLVKDMDDNRERLVVILAGYKDDMEKFLDTNPGLASRFSNVLEFENYSPEELLDIISCMYKDKNFLLGDGTSEKLIKHFTVVKQEKNFGNGRYARNLCERSIRNLSLRISRTGDFSKEALTTILPEDIA
ncbi:SpoVK/Ycf46/Vps4 family AAA+-type ATPase [Kineothrix alysoides]|uniref:SpoVK/Ycf46/Vps4 family AAA+-type ATPase n=1 Tax=Kineothrix alysoides TaxID=1469948 RepID=A0A4R1QZV9_9FIRM|nr:AAA family ATPase [Kineothrix alysoides]TCL58555.1 SpoVK/Ycf46/Vps4 family AAA+-type ATPase [Kineothrix alysoides]